MIKPSWKDAPEWAQWLAQDYDGEWFWWRDKPEAIENQQFWTVYSGKFCIAADGTPSLNWKETLEARP